MVLLTETLEAIREFLDTGGVVLNAIAIMIFVMWMMILERIFYALSGHRRYKKSLMNLV